ncbi:fumarylacetoacetate hydrolase family protein [Bradyrhizobium sp. AUGA SZCCT0182]|uniref:fumarylacetoacetate hydrolase family protein n=1 Tax=Bradyrhizobium sp. AUGA SZCCT0182 TaxID=2807667 RepID=UPI001BA9F277|nr:fumarylacetoacetate hydrolase family protein [Bradyrhizobium sp. AUGA SZCCT0182]MBR1231782.1 fumarylacetoacetate hydrolase family protein [Bradyrhizobium sp. AUGA SZCCT0182]
MRFATVEKQGGSRLGVCIGNEVVDISDAFGSSLPDLGAFLSAGMGGRLEEVGRRVASASAAARRSIDQTFRPPVEKPGKILCLGLNYRDHAKEAGLAIPEYPVVFLRAATSLAAHNQDIPLSPLSSKLDFEGELAVVIGRRARNVARGEALDYVFGYSILNDLSYRDFQLRTPQWTVGKNFDGTAPLGPVVVTADELPPGAKGLRLVTRVNGEVVQDGTTSDMIFDVADSVADLSSTMTLEPGDVIATGTPAGIGGTRKPPLWLKSGDVCEVEIERIGTLSNRIT